MSTEIAPLAILAMDGVGEGKLGMITTFCRSDQVKVEHSDALLTLVQWDSPVPGVVVVKAFTNSPHLSWGCFGSPYLDITTLSAGTLTTQFPLALLHLFRLLPYSPTQVVLPWEKEGGGLQIYPILVETLWESSEEEHHLSPFYHCQSLSSPLVPIDTSAQTEEVLSFSLALRQLQEATQAKAQLEWWLALKVEGLTKNYEDQQFRMVQKQEGQWTRMAKEMYTTFSEVLSQMRQTDLVRLLPLFLSTAAKSSAGPARSVSEALTAVTHAELKGTTASVSTSSPACRVSTLPPGLLTLDILTTNTPVGHLFFALTLSLKYKKWDCSPWLHTWRSKWQDSPCWHWGRQCQLSAVLHPSSQ